MKGTEKYLALLRGVNVGGNNKVAMSDLTLLFRDAGCFPVQTYIQSGNVIFSLESGAKSGMHPGFAATIQTEIEKRFGFRSPILLRSAIQLRAILKANPYIGPGVSLETLHVAFLADVPDPRRLETLDPDRSPPDTFVVSGQEIYLQFPQGAGRSKLTNAYFDSKLRTVSTVRNWRTVCKLMELLES